MTPRDEDVVALIQNAHRRGLQVVLKPHVDPGPQWRGEISPTQSAAWFATFTNDFLLHYARLAEDNDVELFVIGTEYDSLVRPPHLLHWAEVITAVRQIYHGPLTYAATENSLLHGNLPDWFWQSLDLIGLTFYHDFSMARTPTLTGTLAEWQASGVVTQLQALHTRYQRPVLLAEVGYRSIDYAGIEAWRTEGPNMLRDAQTGMVLVNPEESIAYNGVGQAVLYEALFQMLGQQPWLAGAFLWQYVPDGGCATALRGGAGNTDYSILGKPAALTVQSWFGGPGRPPPQWTAQPTVALVHTMEYTVAEQVTYSWQVSASGPVTFTVELAHPPPLSGVTRTLLVETTIPSGTGRFQQMDLYFCDGDRDWHGYAGLELWVRTEPYPGDPAGCELAVGLIDGRSQTRETWQSSQWLSLTPPADAVDGWRPVRLALRGAVLSERDPWRHPTDFVVPAWETAVDGVLDLTAVRGIRLKTLTSGEGAATCRLWLGPLRAITEAVEVITPPMPPVLDAFEYASAATAARVWQAAAIQSGTVNLLSETSKHAPNSTRSLRVTTVTPCAYPRFEQLSNYFLGGGVDLSSYTALILGIGGDGINAPPYGGELSLVLEDRDGEQWQSTRWQGRTLQGGEYIAYGLEPALWSLTSFTTTPGAKPWLHPADFVLIGAVPGGNHYLDREWIRSLTLKTLTPDESCATYPTFTVWLDMLTVSTYSVGIPEIPTLPVVDHLEYFDAYTARLIWRWAASGEMRILTSADIHAPGSAHSLHVWSQIPAGAARYAQVAHVFLAGPQDWSPYHQLRFWARTANQAPWGGELSVELVETDPATGVQEVWRNTRWFGDSTGRWITITLAAGSATPADPWDPHYADRWVVPPGGQYQDGVLDLTRITEMRLLPLTTQAAAQVGYTEWHLWVDEMTVEP